ncbi:MAG: hypothetical protein L6R19_16645 [Alphaproteobacteria bacterium]|nr:hypothetical protein [Alphaproteobacteria bacterium]
MDGPIAEAGRTEDDLTDEALRRWSDTELAARLDQAARALRFHQACECNGELPAERFWRRAYQRLRLETERRRGPLVQAPGTLTEKLAACRRAHAGMLSALTDEAVRLAEAQRHAGRRARGTQHAGARRLHLHDARLMAGELTRLNLSRRELRRKIADADAALASAGSDGGTAGAPLREAAE